MSILSEYTIVHVFLLRKPNLPSALTGKLDSKKSVTIWNCYKIFSVLKRNSKDDLFPQLFEGIPQKKYRTFLQLAEDINPSLVDSTKNFIGILGDNPKKHDFSPIAKKYRLHTTDDDLIDYSDTEIMYAINANLELRSPASDSPSASGSAHSGVVHYREAVELIKSAEQFYESSKQYIDHANAKLVEYLDEFRSIINKHAVETALEDDPNDYYVNELDPVGLKIKSAIQKFRAEIDNVASPIPANAMYRMVTEETGLSGLSGEEDPDLYYDLVVKMVCRAIIRFFHSRGDLSTDDFFEAQSPKIVTEEITKVIDSKFAILSDLHTSVNTLVSDLTLAIANLKEITGGGPTSFLMPRPVNPQGQLDSSQRTYPPTVSSLGVSTIASQVSNETAEANFIQQVQEMRRKARELAAKKAEEKRRKAMQDAESSSQG